MLFGYACGMQSASQSLPYAPISQSKAPTLSIGQTQLTQLEDALIAMQGNAPNPDDTSLNAVMLSSLCSVCNELEKATKIIKPLPLGSDPIRFVAQNDEEFVIVCLSIFYAKNINDLLSECNRFCSILDSKSLLNPELIQSAGGVFHENLIKIRSDTAVFICKLEYLSRNLSLPDCPTEYSKKLITLKQFPDEVVDYLRISQCPFKRKMANIFSTIYDNAYEAARKYSSDVEDKRAKYLNEQYNNSKMT